MFQLQTLQARNGKQWLALEQYSLEPKALRKLSLNLNKYEIKSVLCESSPS